MSKRCPECRRNNEDARIFCAYCGAALDAKVRLIQDFEKQKELLTKPDPEPKRGEVKFYTSHKAPPKKKNKNGVWIALLVAAAVIAAWFFLHG